TPDISAPRSISSTRPSEHRVSTAPLGSPATTSTAGSASSPTDTPQNDGFYASPSSQTSIRSLRNPADIAWIQSRLREYGYAARDAVGIWGPTSADALVAFRVTNGLAVNELWDEATERKLAGTGAISADHSFLGGWSSTDQCKDTSGAVPLIITVH